MKNNIIILISFVILLTTNLFILKKNNKYVKLLQYKDSIILNQDFKQQQLDYIESNLFSTIKNQNIDIKTKIKTYHIDTLLNKQQHVVVYRYHDTDCESCIHFGMLKLKRLSEYIGNEKIIIFIKTSSKKTLLLSRNVYNINFPMFIIDSLPVHLDQFNIPYLFVLDQNMQINNLFIPDKTIPKYTDKYLNEIQHKYFIK